MTENICSLYDFSVEREDVAGFIKLGTKRIMRVLKLKSTLCSDLGPYMFMPNSKAASISGLYICYCDYVGKKNPDLYKLALNNVNKDDVSKSLFTLLKDRTKKFNRDSYEINAVVLSVFRFSDSRLNVSNVFLSDLVAHLLDIQKSDVVIDFGSGVASFLSLIAASYDEPLMRHELRGVEINSEDVSLANMVLEMCGAKYEIRNADFLKVKADKFYQYDKGYVFPPIGLRADLSSIDINNKELINSRTSSEWLFVLKALEGIKDNGKLVALLPDGALFKASDTKIRQYLLENGLIEGIISLPANAFSDSNIKLSLVVFSNGNKSFKYVDGEELLKELPTKGLNSEEASTDLITAYNLQEVKKYSLGNVENVYYNLSLNSIMEKESDSSLPVLSDVAEVIRGSNMTLSNFKDEIFDGESNYQILTSSDIQENGIINYEKLINIGGGKKYDKFILRKGDVIVTAKSTRVKVAVINIEPSKKIVVTGGMIIIRPNKNKLDGTYLKIYLDSEKGRRALSAIQKGTTIVTISFENLLRLRLDLPSLEKQQDIASHYRLMNEQYEAAKRELDIMEKEIINYINKNIK